MFAFHMTADSVREEARSIQSQTGMKYSEALIRAKKDTHIHSMFKETQLDSEIYSVLAELKYVNFGKNMIPWVLNKDEGPEFITVPVDAPFYYPFELYLTDLTIVSNKVFDIETNIIARIDSVVGDSVYGGRFDGVDGVDNSTVTVCNTVVLGMVGDGTSRCLVLDLSTVNGLEAKQKAIVKFINETVQSRIKAHAETYYKEECS